MTDLNHSSDSIYPEHDLTGMQSGERYLQWILAQFTPWVKGDLCEVGAGIGNAAGFLLASDIDSLVLLEPDAGLYAKLAAEFSDPAVTTSNSDLSDFSSANPAAKFDAIFYNNVLEHIKDDLAELRLAYNCLKPAGRLLIFAPALPILFSENDRQVGHWRRYTKKTLRKIAEDAGFECIQIRYFDFIGAFVWFFACRLLKLLPNKGNVGLYDRIFVPLSRNLERLMPPCIGKNLVLVAIKSKP